MQQAPSTSDAEGSKILGVDPMVALIFGTVLLVLVAMSRRPDEVDAHHRV